MNTKVFYLSALSLLLLGTAFTATSCGNDSQANCRAQANTEWGIVTNADSTPVIDEIVPEPVITEPETTEPVIEAEPVKEETDNYSYQPQQRQTHDIDQCMRLYNMEYDIENNAMIFYMSCDESAYGPYDYYNYVKNSTNSFLAYMFNTLSYEVRQSLYNQMERGYFVFRLVGNRTQRYVDYTISSYDLCAML